MRTRLNSSGFRLLSVGLFIFLFPFNSNCAEADFPKIDNAQLFVYNNFESSFEEADCQPSDLQITGQTGDRYVYDNGSVQFEVQVTGGSELTVFDWFFNGAPLDQHYRQMGIEGVSEADTGYYYCRIQDQCDTFYSDSIYLGLLPNDVYPYMDTSGILIHYGFNGNFSDSTLQTGPAIAQNALLDTGLFALPNEEDEGGIQSIQRSFQTQSRGLPANNRGLSARGHCF